MLAQRIQSSIAMFLIFICTFFFLDEVYLQILIGLIAVIALYELGKNIFKFNSVELCFFYFITTLFSYWFIADIHTLDDKHYLTDFPYITYSNYSNYFPLYLSFFFWVIYVPLHMKLMFKIPKILKLFYGIFIISPLLFSFFFLLHMEAEIIFLLILVSVWISDIGAYFFGKKFGKNKLSSISPGKTIEGVLGALFLNTIYSLFLALLTTFLIFDLDEPKLLPFFLYMLIGLLFIFYLSVILSALGDLYESLLKRISKLKDSSSLLPGHGGFLDRIDGLCSTMPLVTLVILIINQLVA